MGIRVASLNLVDYRSFKDPDLCLVSRSIVYSLVCVKLVSSGVISRLYFLSQVGVLLPHYLN